MRVLLGIVSIFACAGFTKEFLVIAFPPCTVGGKRTVRVKHQRRHSRTSSSMDLLVAGPCINAATETAVSNAVGDYLDVVAEQRSGLSSGLSPVTDEATSFSSLDLLSQAVQH